MRTVMLQLNLKRLIVMRGVKQPRAYLVNHGFSDGEARNLLGGETKTIRFSLLTRLAETFNCTVDELLDWTGDPNHSLAVLSKNPAPDIKQILESKSPKEIEEILRKLSE